MAVRNVPLGEFVPEADFAARVAPLSFWFWVKAGIGFTIGAGIVYIAAAILWLWLLSKIPALFLLRSFT